VVAGGSIVELCNTCVSATAADGKQITTSKSVTVAENDQLLIGGYASEDLAVTVTAAGITASGSDFNIATSAGTRTGSPVGVHGSTAVNVGGGTKLNLFKFVNTAGYVGSLVTEGANGVAFEYVSQCSNRGLCNSETGVCECFSGYANDNCDTQNMLSM
jgi:hypothetical protein